MGVYNNGQLWVTVDTVEVTYWLDGFSGQQETKVKKVSGEARAQVGAGAATTIEFSVGIDPQPEDRRDPAKGLQFSVTAKYSGAGNMKGLSGSRTQTAPFRRAQ